tara:strand:- start:27 stop:221 length:195 start_codon:yes stop_codon:yes gene_type:complete
MKRPNYRTMRDMLALKEAEDMDIQTLHKILLFGTAGWEGKTSEEVLDTFVKQFGVHEIPKKEVK